MRAVAPKYAAANETDSNGRNGSDLIYYNQAHPLQQVIVTEDENADLADMVHRAYYDLFITAMRIPVVKANLYTASTLYSDYKWNQAPYSLADRKSHHQRRYSRRHPRGGASGGTFQ